MEFTRDSAYFYSSYLNNGTDRQIYRTEYVAFGMWPLAEEVELGNGSRVIHNMRFLGIDSVSWSSNTSIEASATILGPGGVLHTKYVFNFLPQQVGSASKIKFALIVESTTVDDFLAATNV